MSSESHALFKVSQGAVLENEKGEILLLKLKNDNWVLPGGHLKKNEDWLTGLKREIYEETGITNFTVKGFVDISVFKSCYGICFHVLLNKNDATIVLSEEHEAFAWVSSQQEASQYTFYHPALRNCVFKGLESRL
jgi:8-oxo-dGTP pyrophosphatase MutT (NUDIX family)